MRSSPPSLESPKSLGDVRAVAAICATLKARRHAIMRQASRVLLTVLLDRDTATVDDVRAAVELPEGIDPVCMGAVPGALARAGIIERAGYAPTNRPDAHARPVSIWKLADRDAAERWLREHPDKPDPMPDGTGERRRQLGLPGVA